MSVVAASRYRLSMPSTQTEIDERDARLDELIKEAAETDARIEKHLQEVARVIEQSRQVRRRLLAHLR
jgi:hypothetical protein